MRRPRMTLLLVLAALVAVAVACGGDDGDDDPGAGTGAAEAGLVLGQAARQGSLEDVLVAVDPDRPGREEVEVAELGRGVPAGPGRAFYEQGAEVVLVDAATLEVTELGLRIAAADLAYSQATVRGGGDTVAVLLAPDGASAALVDLEDGSVTDLIDATGVGVVITAEVAPDESSVLLSTDEGVLLVPTDDPEGPSSLGDGTGEFAQGGDSVLVRGAEGVRLVPVDGGEPTVLSTAPGGAVPVGDRVALSRGDELVLVEPDGEEVASVPFAADLGPVAVPDAVVVPDGDGPSWRLLTEDGTVTELPELEGLVPGFGGRPERWVPFVQTDGQGGIGGRRVLAVDTRDGSVVTAVDLPEGQRLVGLPAVAGAGPGALVSVDDGSGTVAVLLDLDTGAADELGRSLQGAAFAPDGTRVAWSSGPDAELRIAPLDDLDAAQVLDTRIALPLWLPA